jgi:zinc-ribbon domain
MYCSDCGRQNEDYYKYCTHCGAPLPGAGQTASNRAEISPAAGNWQPGAAQFKTGGAESPFMNASMGFVIIAALFALNTLNWYIWEKTIAKGDFYKHFGQYKTTMVLSIVIIAAQFVTMFLFARKEIYKIIILITGLLILGYNIYSTSDTIRRIGKDVEKSAD